MEACVGAHHLSRQLLALGHDVKLVPGQFVKPFLKGQKNDFHDAAAVAEAVQGPTMRFVPTESVDQLDLQALHRVRSRLVSQRTAIVNQIRAFLLERRAMMRGGQKPMQVVNRAIGRVGLRDHHADQQRAQHLSVRELAPATLTGAGRSFREVGQRRTQSALKVQAQSSRNVG